jgi:hypothetical protein
MYACPFREHAPRPNAVHEGIVFYGNIMAGYNLSVQKAENALHGFAMFCHAACQLYHDGLSGTIIFFEPLMRPAGMQRSRLTEKCLWNVFCKFKR